MSSSIGDGGATDIVPGLRDHAKTEGMKISRSTLRFRAGKVNKSSLIGEVGMAVEVPGAGDPGRMVGSELLSGMEVLTELDGGAVAAGKAVGEVGSAVVKGGVPGEVLTTFEL